MSAVIGGSTVLRMPPCATIVPAASARCACAPDQRFWSGRWLAGWFGRCGVGARGLVPQPGLIDARPVAPEQEARRLGQQNGVHERDAGQAGQLLPAAGLGGGAPVRGHGRAVVAAWVERKADGLLELGALRRRQPDGLLRPHQRGESLHHVHLDVAVDEELAARSWYCLALFGRCGFGPGSCGSCSGSSNTGGVTVSTTKDSAGPMLRMSIVSPANTHRWACAWKLCHAMPRSRLKTYQRMRWPLWATIVGVLPMNERPLKQNDGRFVPPDSITLCCWLVPACSSSALTPRARPSRPAGTNVLAAVAWTLTKLCPAGLHGDPAGHRGPWTPQK